MRSTPSIKRLTTSITISRRLRHVIDAPRAIPPDVVAALTLPLFAHQTDCCSFHAMVQMVGDGLVTLDRDRWN